MLGAVHSESLAPYTYLPKGREGMVRAAGLESEVDLGSFEAGAQRHARRAKADGRPDGDSVLAC